MVKPERCSKHGRILLKLRAWPSTVFLFFPTMPRFLTLASALQVSADLLLAVLVSVRCLDFYDQSSVLNVLCSLWNGQLRHNQLVVFLNLESSSSPQD